MADLIVRGVDDEIERALEARAVTHGLSAEAEHRRILAEALTRPPKRTFAEILSSMPDVGRDEDFQRVQGSGTAGDVFD